MKRRTLTSKEQFDSLCQRYGDVPVVRQFTFVARDADRATIDQEAIRSAHRKILNESRLIEFIYSTSGMKRDGNVVEQDGWDLAAYRKNPSFLWCHMRDGEPLGRSVNEWLGRNSIGKVLRGIVEFLPEGDNPQADRIFKYYQTGFLNAVSASWKPLRFELIDEEELKESKYGEASFFGGIRFTRSEMLEVSACPVPADPDALQKRIQSGEIRAEDFTLTTPKEYVYQDGRKTGLFYLDAHEFEPDSRTIIDMGTSITPQDTPSTLNTELKRVADVIRALGDDGYVVSRVSLTMPTDQQAPNLGAFADLVPHTKGTVQYVQNVDKQTHTYSISFAPTVDLDDTTRVRLPMDAFVIEAAKARVEDTTERGVVDFATHGRVDISDPESAWNSAEARKRLLEWATAEDGEIDFKKFRKGFAWFDETRKDSLSGYKLIHHDIIDNKFVSVRSGLVVAAQRVMQQSIDIPEGDYAGVRSHLKKEFELFNETPPWERTLGTFYEDLHVHLRSERYTTPEERNALRESAQRLSLELFGSASSREPWQHYGGETDTPEHRLYAVVQDAIAYFTNDREMVEELFLPRVQCIVEELDGMTGRTARLESVLKRAADDAGLTLDISSDESVRAFLGLVTAEKKQIHDKLRDKADRISRMIGTEPEATPIEDSGSGDDVIQRILRMVEDRKPSRGHSEPAESESTSDSPPQ